MSYKKPSSGIWFVILATIIIASRAYSCSPSLRPTIEATNKVLARNTNFYVWHQMAPEIVTVELWDSEKRRVPAILAVSSLPVTLQPEANSLFQFHDVQSQRFELQPVAPLAPGVYTLNLEELGWGLEIDDVSFRVGNDLDQSPPAAPRDLSVSFVNHSAQTGVRSDCSPVTALRPFVALDFHAANDADFYQITAVPAQGGQLDSSRRARLEGLHPRLSANPANKAQLEIPAWWLDGLNWLPGDDRVQLELRAVDYAGNNSDAVVASVERATIQAAMGPTSKRDPGIETRYLDSHQVADLTRFRASALEPEFFDKLRSPSAPIYLPSPPGAAFDRAWQRNILARDGPIPLLAALPGYEEKSLLSLSLEVRDGRIEAPLTAQQLQNLIDALPLTEPAIEDVKVLIRGNLAFATIILNGDVRKEFRWTIGETPDIKSQVAFAVRQKEEVERNEIYRALVKKLGPPDRPHYASNLVELTFKAPPESPLQIWPAVRVQFVFKDAAFDKIHLNGRFAWLEVGELAAPIRALREKSKLTEPQLQKATLSLDVQKDGQLQLMVSSPSESSEHWKGELGKEFLRPRDH